MHAGCAQGGSRPAAGHAPRTACTPPVGHVSPSVASSRGVPEGGVETPRSGAWRARWCHSGKRRPTLKRKSGKKAGGENTKRTKIGRQSSYVRGEGAALLRKSFSCRFHLSFFFSSSFPLSRFVSSSLPGESYARGNCASMMVGLKRPSLARLSLFDRVISSFSRFFFVSCLSVSLCISLVLCPFPLLRMRVFFPLSCSTALRCSFFFWEREASFLVFPRAPSLDFTSRCFVRALSLSLCAPCVQWCSSYLLLFPSSFSCLLHPHFLPTCLFFPLIKPSPLFCLCQ